MTSDHIKLKRVYEPVALEDGLRILVERLWPRGVSKEKAKIDDWAKEIAPSTELRQWYAHQLERWPAFREKYTQELNANPEAVSYLRALCSGHQPVTFVYAAKDETHNSAIVLKHFMEGKA